VTSTTNKLLVRFSTNENSYNDVFFKGTLKDIALEKSKDLIPSIFLGFLAFYTTVPIEEKFPKTIIGSTVVADTQSSMESKQLGTTERYLPFGTTGDWPSALTVMPTSTSTYPSSSTSPPTTTQTSTSTSPSTYHYWKQLF
jgi:hypothetical protein